MNIKIFFIDIGGVLVRTENTHKRKVWEKKLKLKPRQLTRELYKIQPATEATIGLVGANTIWQNVCEKYSLNDVELKQLRKDFFAGDKLNKDFYKFIQILHKTYKIALFSNAWDDARETNIENFHLDRICERMIISAEEGTRKPNKKFFIKALSIMNTAASESVFVDDRMENIKAAKEIGFQTILFKNTNDTIAEINELIRI